MHNVMQPLRITLRSLSRQPGLALVVVLTLALGIGASTALFAYLSAILWPRLDAPDAGRAVWVYGGDDKETRMGTPYLDYLDLKRQQTALRDLVAIAGFGSSVGHGDESTFAWAEAVSGNFFGFFGVQPILGRLFQPSDDEPGADPVVVVTYLFWKGALGGDPDVVGQPLRINNQTFTLVGVLPKGFQGTGRVPPVYIPLVYTDRATGLSRQEDREQRMLSVLGRIAPSLTAQQAQAALDLAARNLDAAAPLSEKRRISAVAATSYDPETSDVQFFSAARVLMAAALLFLLLACANVANLLLARATTRQKEWGIRASLGADRLRLAGSVLSESVVLCLAGGLLGLAFAAGLSRRIEAYIFTSPGGLGEWAEGSELLRMDFRVFGFALLIALACALLCGLAPVLQILRGDLLAPIKADTAGAVGPPGALAARKLLVVAQVGFCVLLVLSGGLLVRTLGNASRVDPGFNAKPLLLATLFLPRNTGTDTPGGFTSTYSRMLEEVSSMPGVEAASLVYQVPFTGWARKLGITIPELPGQPQETGFNVVGPGYFQTLGIPLLQGRELQESDRLEAPAVVVVNRELARRLWGPANPMGRTLSLAEPARPGEPSTFEVVGVVGDVRETSVLEPPGPSVYFSYQQRTHPRMTLAVRAAGSTAALAPEVRKAVRTAHPDLTVVDMLPASEQMERSLVQQRMHAEIAGLFALLGLGVAAIGLFALLSYTVSLRVREFGIRMAVGAGPGQVLGLVLRQGMTLVAVGLALGLAGAVMLTRLLAGLLFGVEANDPVTFVGVPILMVMVTLAACWLPARRAARLDPLGALRGS